MSILENHPARVVGRYEAALIIMRLTSNTRATFLIGTGQDPSEPASLVQESAGTTLVHLKKPVAAECLSMLETTTNTRSILAEADIAGLRDATYVMAGSAVSTQGELVACSASTAADQRQSIKHLYVSNLDIPAAKLFNSKALDGTQSLSLVGADITDEDIKLLVDSHAVNSLRWLDLSSNEKVTEFGVRLIAEKVQSGVVRHLEWLELFGTACDATPYIDGRRWRISGQARTLSKTFGVQRWMMLGCKVPAAEGQEILRKADLTLPPDPLILP